VIVPNGISLRVTGQLILASATSSPGYGDGLSLSRRFIDLLQAEMLYSATSLLGVLAVPFVGQEILQRCQKEGTELAPLGINLR
jgi:hypothetical protein